MSNELETLWNAFVASTWQQMSVPSDTIKATERKEN
jgi:hypothetical protein